MSNIIDSIRMSGTTYAISDSGGTKVVEITQSDYDNLPTSAKTANIMYVITDAEPFDVSNYYTKAETSGATELATAFAATQPKLSAGTNITIDANNVISAEGGGGKAVVGGRGITVTSGETADTINCTLPISAGTGAYSAMLGQPTSTSDASGSKTITGGQWSKAFSEGAVSIGQMNEARGQWSWAIGNMIRTNGKAAFACGDFTSANANYAFSEGTNTAANTQASHAAGSYTSTKNRSEFSIGEYNDSVSASTTFGNSGNTLFSVGNGTSNNARHNAFEIRQNGDIYLTKDGQDVKLQDQLGGGGGGIDSGTVQTMIDQSISGKTNQTDFVSHSGNTSIHVTANEKSTWNAKSDFSGSYNDLTDKPTIPIVPTNVSSFNNDAGYITSNDISGKTNQTDFVSHSGNTTMHVTAQDKTNWNNKSDFSGSYNDLSNKPTIPTSASQLTNDSGYITSSALNGYATEAYVTAATNDMATKTWVGQQGYLTQHQDISGKQDVSGMTAYTTTATTNTLSGTVTAHTADTTIHVTSAEKATWNAKSDFSGDYNDLSNKLSAGTNITIVDNVISAEGGSDINVVQTTGTSTADVMSQNAVTNAFNEYTVRKDSDNGIVRYWTWKSPNHPYGQNSIFNFAINGKCPLSKENGVNSSIWQFNLVETSAITSSVTSSSTDAQVPSAKAVYDQLGGLKLVKLSQSEYDSLATKDNSTLYVIVN